MKAKTIMYTLFLSVLVLAFSAPAQQKEGKGKDKKEYKAHKKGQKDKHDRGHGNDKESKAGKLPPGQGKKVSKDDDGERYVGKVNKGNRSAAAGDDDRGNAPGGPRVDDDGVWRWTPETFEQRRRWRDTEKVTICHKPRRDDEPGVTIRVSANALKAHLNHGDVTGECPRVENGRYTDRYLNRRADYYNVLQNGNEQVLYSRSILDYARERLGLAKQQLVVMRQNNAPADEIERRQLVVTELEQRTSALEQLLQVATTVITQRLMR